MGTTAEKLETLKHIREIQEWILQDKMTTDIVTDGMTAWGISRSTMYRYFKKAFAEFEAMTRLSISQKRSGHILRRQKIILDMDPKHKKTPHGASVILEVQKDIAKLEGLYVEKHEVKVSDTRQVIKIGGKEVDFT